MKAIINYFNRRYTGEQSHINYKLYKHIVSRNDVYETIYQSVYEKYEKTVYYPIKKRTIAGMIVNGPIMLGFFIGAEKFVKEKRYDLAGLCAFGFVASSFIIHDMIGEERIVDEFFGKLDKHVSDLKDGKMSVEEWFNVYPIPRRDKDFLIMEFGNDLPQILVGILLRDL